jgi:hypothetical protein
VERAFRLHTEGKGLHPIDILPSLLQRRLVDRNNAFDDDGNSNKVAISQQQVTT